MEGSGDHAAHAVDQAQFLHIRSHHPVQIIVVFPADHLRVGKADVLDAQAVDYPGKGCRPRPFNALGKILPGFFSEAVHGDDFLPVPVQMEQIRKTVEETSAEKFLQRGFGKAVDVQRIPADEQGKCLQFFCVAVRICAVEGLHVVHLPDLRLPSADRTGIRNGKGAASGQVFRNLRNDHVRLVNGEPVPDSKLQALYNAYVMNAGPAHGGALQLHRLKNGNRIDQAGTAGAPFHFKQGGFRRFILPLERNGIPGELGRGTQGKSVGDIIIDEHQAVRRNGKGFDSFLETGNRLFHVLCVHLPVLHHIKALRGKEFKLLFSGIFKIRSFRTNLRIRCGSLLRGNQRESIKAHVSLRCDLTGKLAHGTGAEVSRVLIARVGILYFFIDLFKILIGDDGLAAQHQLTLKGNDQRDVHEHLRIGSNHLSDLPVSPGDRLEQGSVPIGEHHGQAVQLPGKKSLLVSQPVPQFLSAFRLSQRKHGALMAFLGKLVHRLVAHRHRRASGQHGPGFLFQRLQLVIQSVVFVIAHDLPVLGIIGPGRFGQFCNQFFHSCCLVHVYLHVGTPFAPAMRYSS